MTETKFTPGPWVKKRNGVYLWVEAQLHSVCAFYVFNDDGSIKQTDNANANAQLISAAPDLYEALAAMMSERANGPDSAPIWYAAQAALAKARGET